MNELALNKKIVCQFYNAFNINNASVFDDILDVKWQNHPADPGRTNDINGFKLGVDDFHQAFENFKLEIKAIIAESDLVSRYIKMSGKHVKDLGNWKASHNNVEFYGMDMHKLYNGKIISTWHFENIPY